MTTGAGYHLGPSTADGFQLREEIKENQKIQGSPPPCWANLKTMSTFVTYSFMRNSDERFIVKGTSFDDFVVFVSLPDAIFFKFLFLFIKL